MSAVTRPRGPHSPRVYWRRRLVLAAVAAVLVVLVGRLLGGGSDGDGGDEARVASGDTSTSSASTSTAPEPVETSTAPPPPATPEGRCAPEDVAVRAKVERAVAGSPVEVTLLFSSKETPACYWTASPSSTVVKVTSGDDDIWSTQHCPDALPEQELVLRTDAEAPAEVTWPAWRSGAGCELMQWSLPGFYHVESAALAGEPTDVQFELTTPQPEVIERTITPDPTPDPTADPTEPTQPTGTGTPTG